MLTWAQLVSTNAFLGQKYIKACGCQKCMLVLFGYFWGFGLGVPKGGFCTKKPIASNARFLLEQAEPGLMPLSVPHVHVVVYDHLVPLGKERVHFIHTHTAVPCPMLLHVTSLSNV